MKRLIGGIVLCAMVCVSVSAQVRVVPSGGSASSGTREPGFTPGKEADNNLLIPTAYTLHGGEWQIGIGPVWYGITDHIMVGTNVWLICFGSINVNAKVNILNENKGSPIGLGLNFGYSNFELFGVKTTSIGGGAAISKVLISAASGQSNKGRMDMHICADYAKVSSEVDFEDTTFILANPEGTSIGGGLDCFVSRKVRLIADAVYVLPFEVNETEIEGSIWFGGGVHVAWNTFHAKFGLGTSPDLLTSDFFLKFMPYVNLGWRFGGKPPTGN